MNIDVSYIDGKFRAMLNGNDYKDVSKIIDYVIIEKYDRNNKISSVPVGYGNKSEFPIGIRRVNKSFLEGIQKFYVEETIKYIKTLMPVKPGERIWIDFASRFLSRDNEEFCETELHGGFWIDFSNFDIELNSFINILNDIMEKSSCKKINGISQKNSKRPMPLNFVIPKSVVEKKDNGIQKSFKRKPKRRLKDLI